MMKIINKLTIIIFLLFQVSAFAQNNTDSTSNKSTITFKKRVLENAEIDLLTSFYTQDGNNSAVTGGIGTEKLDDYASNINIAIPLNDDDILTIDATVSAYSSASSSNLNPFSGASSGDDDDDDEDDDDDDGGNYVTGPVTGTPWVESSGASKSDVWVSGNIGYSHSSDNRNNIYSANINVANEYDYISFGAGVGFVKLFNQKNTELSLKANAYLDSWRPEYPTEIKTYIQEDGNLNADFFNGVDILDSNGNPIDKNGTYVWQPSKDYLIKEKGRNTYSFSLGFSQILSKKMQISIFSDITYQTGWLANPMQRVYFADKDDFYIGNASSIPNYTNPSNKDVFQLADDIERLPNNRLKIPIGIRWNYYINEFLIVKTYYRYYFDDWGVSSNTFNIELPIKIGDKFTIYPNYRFYNQTAADYFASFEQHLSTSNFYTSDFDLSKFSSNKFGIGIKYTDIFTKGHLWKFRLKNITLNYNYYERNTGLKAHNLSLGTKIIFD
ncbi:MAG: DUF3570 domain-containing protein [Bacteroidales bacterium]|jgi:hypothetical protein|nr:DUF3570 domain-containing protein [Bacteroidales bacterium]